MRRELETLMIKSDKSVSPLTKLKLVRVIWTVFMARDKAAWIVWSKIFCNQGSQSRGP